MLKVTHCFRCVDLKQGFLTFSIISLMFRVFIVLSICYYMISLLSVTHYKESQQIVYYFIFPILGSLLLWYLITIGLIGISIKGMMEARSGLLKPYFAVVIVELLGRAFFLILSFVFYPAFFNYMVLIIGICIDFYTGICLYSLFGKMKEYERCPTAVVYKDSEEPMQPLGQPSGGHGYPGPPTQNFYVGPYNAEGTLGGPARA
ncbi:hypothetical protein ILUMI_04770 [Ignelater luminosus]|uniref:Uncharacterized protein n=1 Tax=Ignelater luminosus TaxID=2038154 RepID=A0A8K0DE65_IGNLU|nr:hypothetical protein ILUMI_04770 [Ignelater luminosus]